MEKAAIKKALLEECYRIQRKLADTAKAAMKQAQDSANEQKGTMGDKFESFREQCQIDRDMYAKQLQEFLNGLAQLDKIDAEKESERVQMGAVVITEEQNLFIAGSIGKVPFGDKTYMVISPASPLFQLMAGKGRGDSFSFRGKEVKILDIF